MIEQEAREGKLEGVEVHYRRKDRTTFVGLLSTRRVEGDNGETTYFDGAITDITEREHQREALQERQTKIESLYSAADRLLRAASPDRVAEALIELVREVLGYRGVSVRFVREGRLEIASVSESTFDFMPEHPPFDIDGNSALAEVYRTGETLVIEDLEKAKSSRGDGWDCRGGDREGGGQSVCRAASGQQRSAGRRAGPIKA